MAVQFYMTSDNLNSNGAIAMIVWQWIFLIGFTFISTIGLGETQKGLSFIELGHSWNLPKTIEVDWSLLSLPEGLPSDLVIIANRAFPDIRITFSVVRDYKTSSSSDAQQICEDRKNFDKLRSGAERRIYLNKIIDGHHVCVIFNNDPKVALFEELLLPGNKTISQLSIFLPKPDEKRRKQLERLISELRYLK